MRFVYRAGAAVAALAFLALAAEQPAKAGVVLLEGTQAVGIRGLAVGDHRVNIRFDGRSFDQIAADNSLATPFPFLGASFATVRPVLDAIAQLLNEALVTKLLDPNTGATALRSVTPTTFEHPTIEGNFIGPEMAAFFGLHWRSTQGVTLPRSQPVAERNRLFIVFSRAAEVPQPGSMALMALGLTALVGSGVVQRRRSTRS